MKSKVFVSYKRTDKEKVFPIVHQLESQLGIRFWVDLEGIKSDGLFSNVIMDAINQCEVFLFMYSKAHEDIIDMSRDWTIREITFADTKLERIIFVDLDDVKLPDWFLFTFPHKQVIKANDNHAMQNLAEDMREWLHMPASIKLSANQNNGDGRNKLPTPPEKLITMYNGLAFTEVLQKRESTDHIIIYHTEVTSPHTIKDIHQWHLNKGMAGISYHYFIDKQGKVTLGRPYDTKGAFNKSYNRNSIVICFEGDLTKNIISDEQFSEDASDLLMILSWGYSNADILFIDELTGYKGNPVLGDNKNMIREKMETMRKRLINVLDRTNTPTDEEPFLDTLNSQCDNFTLPFEIR